jgi:hypothetical protein
MIRLVFPNQFSDHKTSVYATTGKRIKELKFDLAQILHVLWYVSLAKLALLLDKTCSKFEFK